VEEEREEELEEEVVFEEEIILLELTLGFLETRGRRMRASTTDDDEEEEVIPSFLGSESSSLSGSGGRITSLKLGPSPSPPLELRVVLTIDIMGVISVNALR